MSATQEPGTHAQHRATLPDAGAPAPAPTPPPARDVVLECGWGRLVFGHTFADLAAVLDALRVEAAGHRDICMYVTDPHVLVSQAPDQLFVDPSYTYRLRLRDEVGAATGPRPAPAAPPDDTGVLVRPVASPEDVAETNRIYAACRMVTADPDQVWKNREDATFHYLVAEDRRSGAVVGTVTGVDHVRAFGDPYGGCSLWCLAVDPQTTLPGVGRALVCALVEHYRAAGRDHLDLSVLHDNAPAIALYHKLGFERVPVFCVKRKNPINEPLFAGPPDAAFERLNPYARVIADEARRRGIAVEVLDPEWGEMRLAHGGRRIVTRESLSELTTAVAMSRCDDKRVTRRILAEAGLRVPRGRTAGEEPGEEDLAFLEEVGEVVVKPARGEQGRGITVGVRDPDELRRAVRAAHAHCPDVLLEELAHGEDLRVVVIGHEVVAAAVRRPAHVVGTGRHTVRELVRAQSRRRAAATGGESRIPLDEDTAATARAGGYEMDDVLPRDVELAVRRTANLHTGGTIHDVTADLHPVLAEVAVRASRAIDIPVTGLDLLVPAVDEPEYVLIEANERPGLANHEPQPVVQRFVDLLFPSTRATPWSAAPSRPRAAPHDHRAG
ncbi:N-acetylglutaminylglutamine synthetase [Allostreptomyces psammosilenae]|uniref:GNAT-family acetyltransferase (TIGR03103 family) n=1 Tax=Allostreptomyces psammosilenae TaxID=1892865 RepID=A0A852ZSU0_9ACTN|nr:N-acetylglutaminylglutamine synthetase [Allostreptomyces psammosilenae]NYI04895.1 GNAT-family acetyltransferase (TIGR03103 family) [Allostreptomyces psammosilenae]